MPPLAQLSLFSTLHDQPVSRKRPCAEQVDFSMWNTQAHVQRGPVEVPEGS